jgi:hypothetical protein
VFGEQAQSTSPQLLANTHRGAIGAAVAVIGVMGLVKVLKRR